MNTSFYIPQNNILAKYIRYIQIFEPDNQEKNYLVFPNCGSAITFYKDTRFVEESWSEFSEIRDRGNEGVVLHINRITPVHIRGGGKSTRVSVVFRTLGINHFIKHSLGELALKYNPTAVNIGEIEPAYKLFSKKLFSLNGKAEMIQAIESFFIDQFNNFENEELKNLIAQLEDVYNDNSVEKIAANACMTAKTFERLFKKHVCLNPVQYRNIARFRNSIQYKLITPETTLTDVAAQSNYCDLSYMTKVYEKYTGQSVNSFFKNVKLAADKNYVYQVI